MKKIIKISALAKASFLKKLAIPAFVIGAIITIWALTPVPELIQYADNDTTGKVKLTKVDLQSSLVSSNSSIGVYDTSLLDSLNDDKTLSPYFIVISDDPAVDQLPLKSTSADVNIAGVIADVEITQVYKNSGKNTLEAIYTFPASTNAAVYSMEMVIGKRRITAEIKEKKKAREEYEAAKENGNRASLLEESRPNVFQMNVANISPGDEIKVCLKYTELLVPEGGTYKFVYPTVVGPRYSNKTTETASESDKFVASPYLKEGNLPTYDFNLNASISAGMAIQNVDCNSHKIKTTYPDKNTADIKLDSSEKKGGNRDFILEYKLAGGNIESGLLLYDGGDEKFFLMMVQPPKKVLPEDIPPREYVFIVDASGSMKGFPLDISKKLLRNLITNLRPIDKFNVIVFSSSPDLYSATSLSASSENVDKALKYIDDKQGACGTELLPALKQAFDLPRETESLSRSFVILTDGYVDVEKEAFDLIRNNLNKANFFAFGIGTSVNSYLIEGMAHVGMGEPMIVTKEKYADVQCEKFRSYISSPVLTEIKKDFGKFQAYDVEPLSVPDILAERPVVIFGKYKGDAKGTITVKGHTGIKNYSTSFDVSKVKPDSNNVALRYLWAREKIKFLDDFNQYGEDTVKVKEVTELGLKYNLLTACTSFIAIDKTEVVDKNGKLTTVEQPLPLPEDVSNYAVGADFGLDEETADLMSYGNSFYCDVVIPTTLDETKKTAALTEIENAINNEITSFLSSQEVFEFDSITVSINEKGMVSSVEIKGASSDSIIREAIEKLLSTLDFTSLGINKEWQFIVKF
jgi:Ca-activated chloride channel homolog